jgi:hypothetical protein
VATPLKITLDTRNIQHYLVGAQGALPVDAAGNPCSGCYVYNSGTSSRGGGIAVRERQSWWALPATTSRPGTILGSHGHSHTRAINSCQRRESNRSGLPPVRAPGVGGKERGRHWRSPTRRETALRLP